MVSDKSIRSFINITIRNLQAALNGWFEYGGAVVLPQARFVQDITIGEGESVPPNNQFTKTWRIGKFFTNFNDNN